MYSFNRAAIYIRKIFSSQRDSISVMCGGKAGTYMSIKVDRSFAFVRHAACIWLTPFSFVTREYLFPPLMPAPILCIYMSRQAVIIWLSEHTRTIVHLDRLFGDIARARDHPVARNSVNYSWTILTSIVFLNRQFSWQWKLYGLHIWYRAIRSIIKRIFIVYEIIMNDYWCIFKTR